MQTIIKSVYSVMLFILFCCASPVAGFAEKVFEIMTQDEGSATTSSGIWGAEEKTDEDMNFDEGIQIKEETDVLREITGDKPVKIRVPDKVPQVKNAAVDSSENSMDSFFERASVKSPQPSDGNPMPAFDCPVIKEETNSIYGLRGLKDQYLPEEDFWIQFSVEPKMKDKTWIGIFKPDTPLGIKGAWQKAITRISLKGDEVGIANLKAPMLPGCYEFRMYSTLQNDTAELLRISFKVMPDENSVIPALFLPRSAFALYELIATTVTLPAHALEAGYVLVVPAGTPHGTCRDGYGVCKNSAKTNKMKGKTLGIRAPREPGKYEMRLYPSSSGEAIELASVPFEVAPIKYTGKPALVLDKTILQREEPFSVVFNADPEWPSKAWIGLMPADAPHGNSKENDKYDLAYKCVQKNKAGAIAFSAPKYTGKYELRMLNGNSRKSKEVAVVAFEVVVPPGKKNRKPSMSLSYDKVMPVDVLKIEYAAPYEWGKLAWIGLVPVKTAGKADVAIKAALLKHELVGKAEGKFDFRIPNAPGKYEVRMYEGQNNKIIPVATAPLVILNKQEVADLKKQAEIEAQKFLNNLKEEDEIFNISPELFKKMLNVPVVRPYLGPKNNAAYTPEQMELLRAFLLEMANRLYPDQPIIQYADINSDLEIATLYKTVKLNKSKECAEEIDKEIDMMRKVEVTLGRDNKFKEALWNMATSYMTKWPFKDNQVVKKQLQKIVATSYDTFVHSTAAFDAHQQGDSAVAASQAATAVIKGMINLCDSEECFSAIRKTTDKMLTDTMKKMPPGKLKIFVDKMSYDLGDRNPAVNWIKDMREGINAGLTIDTVRAASQTVDEDYRAMIWTVTSGVASIDPVGHIVVSTGIAIGEGTKALKDMLVDDNTMQLYAAFKESYDGGIGETDWYAAHSLHDTTSLAKARAVIAKNPTNPLIFNALSPKMKERALSRQVIDPNDLSTAEIDKYLFNQFSAWQKEEAKGSKFAEYSKLLRNDFENMECRGAFETARDKKKEDGIVATTWDNTNNWWNDGCPRERDSFKAYMEMRQKIDADIKMWRGDSGKCIKSRYQEQSRALVCRLMRSGKDAYLDLAARYAKDCEWDMGNNNLTEYMKKKKMTEELAAKQERARLATLKIIRIMKKIKKENILNCLCGHSGGIVAARYHPEPTKGASQSCDSPSGGVCIGGNWGCARFNMIVSDKSLKACRVYEAISDYKKNMSSKK